MGDLITERLRLRPINEQDVNAVLNEVRDPSWAPDFPADGDRAIARLLRRSGLPDVAGQHYGHRLVIERVLRRSTATVCRAGSRAS